MEKEELLKEDQCYKCEWIAKLESFDNDCKFCKHINEYVYVDVGCDKFKLKTN